MTTLDISSIGRIAGELQCPVHELLAIAEQLGIVPGAIINGCPHFSAEDRSRIAEHLRMRDKKILGVQEPV